VSKVKAAAWLDFRAMSGEHLREGMHGLASRLTAALLASRRLGDSLTKGELREEEVIDALRPYVPTRYDLVKGVVVTPQGEESDPQDVILIDSFAMPPIFGRGRTKAVPVESVVGVLQVKSGANSSTVKSAVKNLASAKRLLPDTPRYGFPVAGSHNPGMRQTQATFFGGALFLQKDAKKDVTIANAFANISDTLPLRERCDALCVLNEFSILWANSASTTEIELGYRAEEAKSPIWLRDGTDSALYFYLSLAGHLANWISPPIDWLNYARDIPRGMQFSTWNFESHDSEAVPTAG
jgi:Domain of unknown function (DUF6602)